MQENNEIDFTIGRSDFGITVYVPWNCSNNCKFCTSKQYYSTIKSDFESVKKQLKVVRKSLIKIVTFTGGEPSADVEKLKELVKMVDNKTVYINTTLPAKNAEEFIEFVNNTPCIKSTEKNPIILATKLMSLPEVPIHGPVHHFLVPATILTCYNNIYGNKKDLEKQLEEAAKRASIVPGAMCAMCGACGAALGIGSATSILKEIGPLSTTTWGKVIKITSSCLTKIGELDGPRCCKRDTYLAILEGTKKLKQLLDIDLPTTTPHCKFHDKNFQCKKSACPFWEKGNR